MGRVRRATPDPNPVSGTSRVWLVNQFAFKPGTPSASGWKPWNWTAVP
jgi:hypothetical protein